MIASGLRAFYSLEEMQGRRVIVLANLKARNIGGFKSNGMVGGVLETNDALSFVGKPSGVFVYG